MSTRPRPDDKTLLNTREIAWFLDINEKMVYSLIAGKGFPATKATGKWFFPRNLVEQWLENQTTDVVSMLTYFRFRKAECPANQSGGSRQIRIILYPPGRPAHR